MAAPPPEHSTYISLGSSFAAGPGVSTPAEGGLESCGQSADNYARQLARRWNLRLVDRSCGGATTADVLKGGQRSLPAQVDAVTADARLVTITIGGNDVRFVSDLGRYGCANHPDRVPEAYREQVCAAPAGFDLEKAFDGLAANLKAIADAVRRRAPHAQLVFIDYVTIVPPHGVCASLALTEAQAAEMRARAVRLAAVTAEVATEAGAELIKASDLTRDHSVCSSAPWSFGTEARQAAFHPNLKAMTAIADAIARRLEPAVGEIACPAAASGEPRPWLNSRYPPQCRARAVVDSFKSLDEKLDALTAQAPGASGGGDGPAWLTSRGLRRLAGGDGPAGVTRGGLAVTAYPTPLSIAASFDLASAELYGRTLGREFFDYGANRMGGPALDPARTWRFGRLTESFGEDPFLIASIAGAEIKAIQAQNVMSMAKHYAVYTQEQGRQGDHPLRAKPGLNVVLSERTLRQIYLPGFEAAVKVGGVGQIMCSFVRINGVYACENPLVLGILKKEWGFDGAVTPDYITAQRSIVAAVNAGLDLGYLESQPPATEGQNVGVDNSFNGESLRKAVKEGTVSVERIDDLLMRRLTPAFRIGAFDNPAKRRGPEVSTPERRAVAADLATRGAVLLKNEGGVLPFGREVRSIAVIGDQAGPHAIVTELGSAYVEPAHLVPVLAALRERAGSGAGVSHARGTLGLRRLPLLPAGMVRSPEGLAGFRAEYFSNPNLDFGGTPISIRQEAAVNASDIPKIDGLPANRAWSVRWIGVFTPLETGVQKFTLQGSGTARLIIDGKLAGEFGNADFADTIYANVHLEVGRAAEIRVEWTPRVTVPPITVEMMGTTLGPALRLGWAGPDSLIAEAARLARQVDVPVVVVGEMVGEGMDRASLSLQNDQDALIEAVSAANPRTVVVLMTGGPVKMPWLDRVAGVVQMWLPGDAAGPATARVLFGDAEPGGRLPVTFPKDEGQGPATEARQYPGTRDATGALDTAYFDEELLIGYRYWDAKGQEPLFPFGYGLSYTTFQMTNVSVGPSTDGGARVELSVRNSGKRPGSEVVQVYLGFPARLGEPPKQLKAFQKVSLAPGEERVVKLDLPRESFRRWSEVRREWLVEPGIYSVMVGRSSRDLIHRGSLELGPLMTTLKTR